MTEIEKRYIFKYIIKILINLKDYFIICLMKWFYKFKKEKLKILFIEIWMV